MKLHMYSYRSTITGHFMAPMFMNYEEQDAIEALARACSVGKVSNEIAESDLYHLGIFDDNTGLILEYDPKNIANVKSFIPTKAE